MSNFLTFLIIVTILSKSTTQYESQIGTLTCNSTFSYYRKNIMSYENISIKLISNINEKIEKTISTSSDYFYYIVNTKITKPIIFVKLVFYYISNDKYLSNITQQLIDEKYYDYTEYIILNTYMDFDLFIKQNKNILKNLEIYFPYIFLYNDGLNNNIIKNEFGIESSYFYCTGTKINIYIFFAGNQILYIFSIIISFLSTFLLLFWIITYIYSIKKNLKLTVHKNILINLIITTLCSFCIIKIKLQENLSKTIYWFFFFFFFISKFINFLLLSEFEELIKKSRTLFELFFSVFSFLSISIVYSICNFFLISKELQFYDSPSDEYEAKYFNIFSNLLVNIYFFLSYIRNKKRINEFLNSINNLDRRLREYTPFLFRQLKIINYHLYGIILYDIILLILYIIFMHSNYKIHFFINHYNDFLLLLIFIVIYYPRKTLVKFKLDIFLIWLLDALRYFEQRYGSSLRNYHNVYQLDKDIRADDYFANLNEEKNYVIIENPFFIEENNNKEKIENDLLGESKDFNKINIGEIIT